MTRPKKNLYTYNKKSLSLPQWADELGINPKTLQRRLAMGWGIERTLSTPVRVRMPNKERDPIVYEGKVWTIPQLAAKFGIAPQTLYARLDRGVPLEEALEPSQEEW